MSVYICTSVHCGDRQEVDIVAVVQYIEAIFLYIVSGGVCVWAAQDCCVSTAPVATTANAGLKDIFLQAATGLLDLHQRDMLLRSQRGFTASDTPSPLATPPTIPVGRDSPRQPRPVGQAQSCPC